jgi:hypothetical protein
MGDRDRKTTRATTSEEPRSVPAADPSVRTPARDLDQVLNEIDEVLAEIAEPLVERPERPANPVLPAAARVDVPPRGSIAEAVLGPQRP